MNFRKVCSASAFFFLLLFSVNTFGQLEKPAVTDVTLGMLTWIKHLNNEVDKYFVREKGEALSQHFEYLKQDLRIYMKTRKTLSDSLFRNNIAPGKKDINNLENLKAKMASVMERMRGVTDLVNNQLRAEGDKLNDEIYEVLYGQQIRFLSNLEAFLAGMDVSKKELALDGSTCYLHLEESINLISAVQDKIDRKMKK